MSGPVGSGAGRNGRTPPVRASRCVTAGVLVDSNVILDIFTMRNDLLLLSNRSARHAGLSERRGGERPWLGGAIAVDRAAHCDRTVEFPSVAIIGPMHQERAGSFGLTGSPRSSFGISSVSQPLETRARWRSSGADSPRSKRIVPIVIARDALTYRSVAGVRAH
jgi:hypothetical protein